MLKSIKPSDSIFDNLYYQKQKKEYFYFGDLISQKKLKKVKSTDDIFTNETNEANNTIKTNFIPYLPKIKSPYFLNKKFTYVKKANLNNNMEKNNNNYFKENNLNYLYLQYNGKEFDNQNNHIQYMKIRPHELIESLKTYSMPTDVYGIKMVNYVQKIFDDDTYKNNSFEHFIKEDFSNQPCKATIKELVLNKILNNVITHCIEIRDRNNKVITREIIYDELKLQIENARNNLKIIQDYIDLKNDINNNTNNTKKELEKKNNTSINFIHIGNSDKYNFDNIKINNNNIQDRKIKKEFITSNFSNKKYNDNKNFISTHLNEKKISPIKKKTQNNLSSFENPNLFFHFLNLKDNLKSINSIDTNNLIKFICDTPLKLPKINHKKNRNIIQEPINTISNKNENTYENKIKGTIDEEIEDKKLNNRYEFLQKILNNETLSSKEEKNQPSMSSIKSTELQITAKKKNQISQTQNSYMNEIKGNSNDFNFVKEQSNIIGRNIINRVDKKIIEIDNSTRNINQKDINKLNDNSINKSIKQTQSQIEKNENNLIENNINLNENKKEKGNINSNQKKVNIKNEDEDLKLNKINVKNQKQKINENNVKKDIDKPIIKKENERKDNIDENEINRKKDYNNEKENHPNKDTNNFLKDSVKKKDKKEDKKENSQNTSIKYSKPIKNNNKISYSNLNSSNVQKNIIKQKSQDELTKNIETQNLDKEDKIEENFQSIKEENNEKNIKSNFKRYKKNKISNEKSINDDLSESNGSNLTKSNKKKGILKTNYKDKNKKESFLNHSFSNPKYIPIINIKKSLGISKNEIEFELRFLKKNDSSHNIKSSKSKIIKSYKKKNINYRSNFDLQLLKSVDSLNKNNLNSYSSLFNFSNDYYSNSNEEIFPEKKISRKQKLKQKLISNVNYFEINENENENEKENENKNVIENKDDYDKEKSSINLLKFIKNINEMKKENPNDYVRKLSQFIDNQIESEIFERKKKEAMINGFKYNLKENFIQKSKIKIYNAGKGKIIFKPLCIFKTIKINNNDN